MLYEVILDIGETANKCTIAPLADRADFRIFRVRGGGPLGPLKAPLLLHHEGECITTIRDQRAGPVGESQPIKGVATIDCVWRRLDPLLKRIEGDHPRLARIPDGFITAYPRKSAHDFDPEGGLATIEAIFAAAALLGNWDASLLSAYFFGRRFVELNAKRFVSLGVMQAADPSQWPVHAARPRSALQRKLDRGQRH